MSRNSAASGKPRTRSREDGSFGRADRFLEMGRRLVDDGKGALVPAYIAAALAQRPGDPLIAQLASMIAGYQVPEFHDGMLHDAARNAAYARAIEAVARGRVVLDIGAGAGLLALLAARAGAAHVYACEVNPVVAARCREIVAANGYADRVTVLPVHSGKLDRIRDLGGGADLIVSEIFARDLLGEGVLPSLAHARAQLAAPGAVFLPERASIRVALAHRPFGDHHLADVEGFDLSAFAIHCDPSLYLRTEDPGHELRGPAADLFGFEFAQDCPLEERATIALVSDGGRVGGVAQWLRIEFGGGAVYENAPADAVPGHWGVGYYPLARTRETARGERVPVHGWHGASAIALWGEA